MVLSRSCGAYIRVIISPTSPGVCRDEQTTTTSYCVTCVGKKDDGWCNYEETESDGNVHLWEKLRADVNYLLGLLTGLGFDICASPVCWIH